MFLKRKLKNAVKYYKYHQINLYKILDFFEMNNLEYAFVGGFVKDIVEFDMQPKLVKPKGMTPRIFSTHDFDIIVDTDYDNLKHMLKWYKIPFRANDFGSFKIKEHPDSTFNHEIDIWCLKDHRPFTQHLFRKDWKNIPQSAWLSICGAAYLPLSNKLYLGDLKKTLKTKTITMYKPLLFFSNEIDNKFILVGKLFYLWYNFGYKMDQNCVDFLSSYLFKLVTITSIEGCNFQQWIKNDKHINRVGSYISHHYGDSLTDWPYIIAKTLDQREKYQYKFLETRK